MLNSAVVGPKGGKQEIEPSQAGPQPASVMASREKEAASSVRAIREKCPSSWRKRQQDGDTNCLSLTHCHWLRQFQRP